MGLRIAATMAESTEAVKRALLRGLARARESWSSLVLAAVAAAIAWFIAHDLLGHQQPFFAPIAAAVTLSVSRVQRTQRIVQLVGGVLLGIGIGEGLSAALGTSTYALGLIVLVTFLAAVITGVGFVGEGMMFANQAAASAILVVTLHQHWNRCRARRRRHHRGWGSPGLGRAALPGRAIGDREERRA